jgi:cytidine deaminase
MITIDWQNLRDLAAEAAWSSYSPYSNFKVGCAVLGEDGVVYTGCNVENASYGLTLCAECGAISAATLAKSGGIVAIVSPCGRCRQLLIEVSPYALYDNGFQTVQVLDLLPGGFRPDDLV